MNTIVWILVVVAVVGVAIWLVCRNKQREEIVEKLKSYEVKNVEGELTLSTVVEWFKSLNLDSKKDVPFICKGSVVAELVKKYFKSQNIQGLPASIEEKADKVVVFCAVFDEKNDEIVNGVFISADSLDAELLKLLADNEVVVLN